MKYYNVKVALMPLKDIIYEKTYEELSKLISQAMLYDEKLKILHKENTQKLYTFCGFYPIEKDTIYKAGRVYTFDIRSIQEEFANKIKNLLMIVNNEKFKVIMTSIEVRTQKEISKLITLTPSIITTLKGDYDIKDDMELVKKRILDGAQKKYFKFTGEKLNTDFIKSIKKTNRTPIKIPYKNIYFLGNKFEIEIKQDEDSQNLAYMLLATGMLEKNAIRIWILQS